MPPGHRLQTVAGQTDKRRLEGDLQDGAQQWLVGILLGLCLLRGTTDAPSRPARSGRGGDRPHSPHGRARVVEILLRGDADLRGVATACRRSGARSPSARARTMTRSGSSSRCQVVRRAVSAPPPEDPGHVGLRSIAAVPGGGRVRGRMSPPMGGFARRRRWPPTRLRRHTCDRQSACRPAIHRRTFRPGSTPQGGR
jgi:hypothetical protein